MPGFYSGRLLDRSAAVVTLTYDWPIGPWLDGALQASTGNVFGPHLDGMKASLLRYSGALGLSVVGFVDPPIQLLLGFGSETFEHGGQVDSFRLMLGAPQGF